ncbi:MAG TPA: TAXI family TRAP transporter solute-binding subunit [Stellaceae bacterium]|jgi:TRAP-type uncharacterized transport system substrate-binding protein|nr:TAXI family TRAP transporter solute-binding subunit [Stellaceae bacterium]
MTDVPTRYNSGIQRAKGLMELGAALYDTSLSRKSTRSGTTTPQTDSRIGTNLSLRINLQREGMENGVALSFGIGGSYDNFMKVANKELSLLWINPSVPLALAYKGLAPFSKPLPLRTIAVFPSWDAVVIAVHESTGITAIEQIRERRVPLRLSTGHTIQAPYDEDTTMFAVSSLIDAAGFSLDDIRAWGGTVTGVPRPSHPSRAEAVTKGEINAIFDEGILSWGNFAVERGFRFLPVEGALRERIMARGFDMVTIPQSRIAALKQPVTSVDFSGWPMIVHAEMPDDVAYALCEALEARKLQIPTDNYKPVNLTQLCTPDAETPRTAPLHPGAERFYRERGYLK